MKNRVVVTGMGIISSLGNDLVTVKDSIRNGKSGIKVSEDHVSRNLKCTVTAEPSIADEQPLDRKVARMTGITATYAYMATEKAIADSGLKDEEVQSPRTGLIIGDGGGSVLSIEEALNALAAGKKRVSPFFVPKTMNSSCSAILSTFFKTLGPSFTITSACATSAHCIGVSYDMIASGVCDRMVTGGSEACHWLITEMFDSMGALVRDYGEDPTRASKPYDKNRGGFVPGAGAAVLILENREVAERRGAKIYAEVDGYSATSDGHDIAAPSGEGAERCLKNVLETVGDEPDYINAHATSTPAGDIVELEAIDRAMSGRPYISSTKSLTGHNLGGAGAMETLFSILMIQGDFITPCFHIDELDPDAKSHPLALELIDNAGINRVLSNSFGFGGTNCVLALSRYS